MRRFFLPAVLLAALLAAPVSVDAGRFRRSCSSGSCSAAGCAAPVMPSIPAAPVAVEGDDVQQLLVLHNSTRASRGLPALELCETLCSEAKASATAQRQRGRCGHFLPLRSGGENCAMGQSSPSEAVGDWLSSPGHAANIRGNWTRVGFGRDGNAWAARFAN